MKTKLSAESISQLFTDARTHHAWTDRKVSSETLHELYELAKWGPTAINASPFRILFITSDEAKAQLVPGLMGSNVGQVNEAPVTAVIAWDQKFYDQLPTLFPQYDARPMFVNDPAMVEIFSLRNSSLQGAYLIMAARALGLDACPMSGFDHAKVDEIFFKGTSWKSNFICTLGYGDDARLTPRNPRLSFDQSCKVI